MIIVAQASTLPADLYPPLVVSAPASSVCRSSSHWRTSSRLTCRPLRRPRLSPSMLAARCASEASSPAQILSVHEDRVPSHSHVAVSVEAPREVFVMFCRRGNGIAGPVLTADLGRHVWCTRFRPPGGAIGGLCLCCRRNCARGIHGGAEQIWRLRPGEAWTAGPCPPNGVSPRLFFKIPLSARTRRMPSP